MTTPADQGIMAARRDAHNEYRKIGKLEDGSKDPCYDCRNCDTNVCLSCTDYDRAEGK